MMHVSKAKAGESRMEGGFTLIEVMVSTVVLAIGLVGVAALQGVALKNNQSSFMRSQASILAYDLADRMRANVPGVLSGSYDPGLAAASSTCETVSGCSPAALAAHDLSQWNTAIGTHLPSGQGFVCIDSTPNDGTGATSPECDGNGAQTVIKIWWDDDRDGATTVNATNNERFVVSLRL